MIYSLPYLYIFQKVYILVSFTDKIRGKMRGKSIFHNLGQEDVPQLQSLADKETRIRNLKLMLCKNCQKNPDTYGVVPKLLIEGINIDKIKKSKNCWYCGIKK